MNDTPQERAFLISGASSPNRVLLPENLTPQALQAEFSRLSPGTSIDLDGSLLKQMTPEAAAFLLTEGRKIRAQGGALIFSNLNPTAEKLLQRVPILRALEKEAPDTSGDDVFANPLEAFGNWILHIYGSFRDIGILAWQLNKEMLPGLNPQGPFFSPFVQMARVGVKALPVVISLSLLFGCVLALMSSIQAKTLSLGHMVATLMSIGVVRELGPIMTAIILTARSGSSIAAELGTMAVTEELDALRAMGLPPERTLAVPRLFSMMIMGIILTVVSCLIMLLGGYFIGLSYLDAVSSLWLEYTLKGLEVNSILISLSKGLVFGYVIGLIGISKGFSVRGGPNEVGNATTSAVVESIVAIILIDAAYNVIEFFVFK